MTQARFKVTRWADGYQVILSPSPTATDSMTVDNGMTEYHAAALCDALNAAVRTCDEAYNRPGEAA